MKIVLTNQQFLTKPIHIPCYYFLRTSYPVTHSLLQITIFSTGKAKTKARTTCCKYCDFMAHNGTVL